jgi:hypothetical protein
VFSYYFLVPVPHPFSATASSELFGDSIEVSFPTGATVHLHWDVTSTSAMAQFVSLCGCNSWVYNATGLSSGHTFVVMGDVTLCGFWANGLGPNAALHVSGSFEAPRVGPL